jgi:hypothetical protein
MSGKVAVDTAQLRGVAGALTRANEPYARPVVDVGRLGSPGVGHAAEGFEDFWGDGQETLTSGLVGLREALSAVAGAYEQRDAEAASRFSGGGHAF